MPLPHKQQPLSYLPKSHWWKLFIDKKDHHLGALAYDVDQSPGHKESMESVMEQVLANPKEGIRLNASVYDGLHRSIAESGNIVVSAAREVKQNTKGDDIYIPPSFGTHKIGDRALRELKRKRIGGKRLLSKGSMSICKVTAKNNLYDRIYTNYTRQDREGIINDIFTQHYESMDKQKSDRGRIEVVADTVRSLHVGHFFSDGNGRLNMPIVMNKLLSDAGFVPAILPEGPAVFGGHKTKKELADDIISGMNTFADLVKDSSNESHNMSSRIDSVKNLYAGLSCRTEDELSNSKNNGWRSILSGCRNGHSVAEDAHRSRGGK